MMNEQLKLKQELAEEKEEEEEERKNFSEERRTQMPFRRKK